MAYVQHLSTSTHPIKASYTRPIRPSENRQDSHILPDTTSEVISEISLSSLLLPILPYCEAQLTSPFVLAIQKRLEVARPYSTDVCYVPSSGLLVYIPGNWPARKPNKGI
ncbi:hypothetical protein PM082_011770 [Marasmius tenuissimus]|nr:hypothetical protein PM082_011770 [Marasmius tenuissimus]